MIAFLKISRIQFHRDELLRPWFDFRHRRWRSPFLRRRFTPPKNMPDPYVAAVLIALAQSQRLRREKHEWAQNKQNTKRNTNQAATAEETGITQRFPVSQNPFITNMFSAIPGL